jgi:hypothetical protein
MVLGFSAYSDVVSNTDVVYGYILEPPASYQPTAPDVFRTGNDAVIQRLPPGNDTWPPLARAMVSVTGPESLGGSAKHRRVISVTGHFNHFFDYYFPEKGLREWLDKLEAFLRATYWLEARFRVGLGWCGHIELDYRAHRSIPRLQSTPPQPCDGWELRCTGNEFVIENAVKHRPEFTTKSVF